MKTGNEPKLDVEGACVDALEYLDRVERLIRTISFGVAQKHVDAFNETREAFQKRLGQIRARQIREEGGLR